MYACKGAAALQKLTPLVAGGGGGLVVVLISYTCKGAT